MTTIHICWLFKKSEIASLRLSGKCWNPVFWIVAERLDAGFHRSDDFYDFIKRQRLFVDLDKRANERH